MKNSILYKIGFNTLIQFIGKAISVLLGLATVALLTRYLGLAGYGNFTLVFAYMSFFGVFADFGLQLAIVRELSQKNIDADSIYGTYFWIKSVLIGVSTFVAIFALLFFPYSEELKIGILIGALAVGIGGLSGYGSAIFQSRVRLDIVTYIDVLTKIITVVFIIFFVFSKMNFYYIVSTVLIGNITGFIATVFILKKFINFNFKYDKVLAKKIIGWSIPIGLTSFFSLAYFKIDTIMLSVMKGPEEVGIYSLAYKILENILILWGLYMASVYPFFSRLLGDSDKKNFYKIFKNTIVIALLFSMSIVLIGLIFSDYIINIFAGDKFNQSSVSFKILLLSLPIYFMTNTFYNALLSLKKINFIIYSMVACLLLNFLLNLILIPKMGYVGASINTVLTEGVMLIAYILFSIRKAVLRK